MEEKNINSEKIALDNQSASKDSFIKESFLAGWNILRWRPWYVAGIPALVGLVVVGIIFFILIIPILISLGLMAMSVKSTIMGVVGGILMLGIIGASIYLFLKFMVPASMFQYIFIRNILLNKKINIKETFKSLMNVNLACRFFSGILLMVMTVFGGMLLLIVPGIIWGVKFMFVPMLILDKNMKIIEAFRASSKMTNGYKWPLFAYGLLIGLVGLGLVGSILGSLIMTPIFLISYVFIYLVFSKQTNSIKAKIIKAPVWQLVLLIAVSVILQILSFVGNSTK